MKILHWKINPVLQKTTEADYRNQLAAKLQDHDALTILRDLSLDGVAPNITFQDLENLIKFTEKKFLERKLSGVGLELGSGPAPFSAVLAKRPEIQKMYAVELCRPIVEILLPKMAEAAAGPAAGKIVGCVGEFDNLELPDNYLDFMIDFFSLHHSPDPIKTLKECRRVLKSGGVIICFDKARPDDLTTADLDRLLDKEYEDDFKKRMGIPLTQKLTRRQNGEHEYRLKDWQNYFNQSGFSEFYHFRLDQCRSGLFPIKMIKYILSILPVKMETMITQFLPQSLDQYQLAWDNRLFTPIINNFRKEMSLMIASQ